MMDKKNFGSLVGLRILDLTQMLAGPFGTMMLADHGATVIKIEPPEGDLTRAGGPYREDDSLRLLGGYFQSINRNKQSVCLDLKSEVGREALLLLVRDADALVENFRGGVMDRLGVGYERLKSVNPRLVYGALRGFGDTRTAPSPYAEWPAYDVVAQALGGIMGITGPDPHTPTKIGPGVGDTVPGMMLAFGVLAAIHHAQRTGEGQFVDISMADAVLALSERIVWQHSVAGLVPGPEGNHHPFLCPFGIFPAADGHVTVAAQQNKFFEILCREIGADALLEDERFRDYPSRSANRQVLIVQLGEFTSRLTKAEMLKRLGGRIPFAPVLNIAEIVQNPHFIARDMIVEVEQPGSATPISIAGVPIKMTATPGQVATRAPFHGEHSEAWLRLAGVPEEQIAAILAATPEKPKRQMI